MSSRIQNVHPKVYNGRKYRSTLEARTAEMLDKLKVPFEYETVKMVIQPTFQSKFQKNKIRAVTYTPDFILLGHVIIECKGFETPEWKLKKKFLFKYMSEHCPQYDFYQTGDCGKSLIEVLDNYWQELGLEVVAEKESFSCCYPSVSKAMNDLALTGRPVGRILKCLTGDVKQAYGYSWKLKTISK